MSCVCVCDVLEKRNSCGGRGYGYVRECGNVCINHSRLKSPKKNYVWGRSQTDLSIDIVDLEQHLSSSSDRTRVLRTSYSACMCLRQLHIAIVLNLGFDPSPTQCSQVRARAESCTTSEGSAGFPVISRNILYPPYRETTCAILPPAPALGCNRRRNYQLCIRSYMDRHLTWCRWYHVK